MPIIRAIPDYYYEYDEDAYVLINTDQICTARMVISNEKHVVNHCLEASFANGERGVYKNLTLEDIENARDRRY